MLKNRLLDIRAMAPEQALYISEWVGDGSILRYRFENMSRTTVDGWAEDITRAMLTWPADKPWRCLIDLRGEQLAVSAYALRRARDVAFLRPELRGRCAILTTNKITARLASLTIRALRNRYRNRRIFTSESEAIAWLLQPDKIATEATSR